MQEVAVSNDEMDACDWWTALSDVVDEQEEESTTVVEQPGAKKIWMHLGLSKSLLHEAGQEAVKLTYSKPI